MTSQCFNPRDVWVCRNLHYTNLFRVTAEINQTLGKDIKAGAEAVGVDVRPELQTVLKCLHNSNHKNVHTSTCTSSRLSSIRCHWCKEFKLKYFDNTVYLVILLLHYACILEGNVVFILF